MCPDRITRHVTYILQSFKATLYLNKSILYLLLSLSSYIPSIYIKGYRRTARCLMQKNYIFVIFNNSIGRSHKPFNPLRATICSRHFEALNTDRIFGSLIYLLLSSFLSMFLVREYKA